jgi:cytochrome c oxidase subunit 2
MSGFKGLAIAIGLAFAGVGVGQAAQQAPAAPAAAVAPAPAPAAGQQAAEGPGGVSNLAPTSVDATPPAAPNSPALALDGGFGIKPTAAIGQPVDGQIDLQPQVTENGKFAYWFHNKILFPVITFISLLVLALLVWVVVRYRAKANPVPSKTSHNTTIEVLWTLLPVLALVAIAVPSIGLLQAQFKPAPAGAVTLKAIGNQWYWTYQYPDHGNFEVTANPLKERDQVQPGERYRTDVDGPRQLATDNRVVLPVGVPIRLITTANDVIHSWAMPAFWMKLDAIPGRLNETSFTIQKPGLYFGQCSELCGARHAYMPIAVEAVSPAQFAQWVAAKGGTMPQPGAASDKVIPQPGADGSAAKREETTDTANATDPVQNVTITSPARTQGATNTRPDTGNAGQ